MPFPPDPNSPDSTITTVAREITTAGGDALALQVDVRFEESVNKLVSDAVAVSLPASRLPPARGADGRKTKKKAYGRLDVLVYNSGAIYWSSVANTPLKRFQLMQRVNPEGLYAVVQAALPHLSPAARVVVVSPPIYSRFFRGKTAYAMGKVGMSVLTKGLGMDFVREGKLAAGMAISSMWPAVVSPSSSECRRLYRGRNQTHKWTWEADLFLQK